MSKLGRFLLDTNIVIAFLGNEPSVAKSLGTADEVFIPVVVMGELFYGVSKSRSVKKNLRILEELVAHASFLPTDLETARYYGSIKSALHTKGRPIPENDIWIAALAIQHHLTLVTRDRHFAEVSGLQREEW